MFRAKKKTLLEIASHLKLKKRQVRRWVAMRDELDKINDMDAILTAGSTVILTKTIDSKSWRKCSTGSSRHWVDTYRLCEWPAEDGRLRWWGATWRFLKFVTWHAHDCSLFKLLITFMLPVNLHWSSMGRQLGLWTTWVITLHRQLV